MHIPQTFGKERPFLASIKERYWLSEPPSNKRTYHLSLDLRGSGYTYQPGDSVAVFFANPRMLVEQTLSAMRATGAETIFDRKGNSHILGEFLTSKANITEISRQFYMAVMHGQQSAFKQDVLRKLVEENEGDNLKAYLQSRQVWDFLAENLEASLSIQDVVTLLKPLLPRFYSIASAQQFVQEEVHLTVAAFRYQSNGHERVGVCTHYLCDVVPLRQPIVPLYIQPHHGFTLPDNPDADIIMVGPGTGVAPFRAFMQQRSLQRGKGRNWLFFGEWRANQDFFYRDFWLQLHHAGQLKLDTAFSRDQSEKFYVQHSMLQKGQELYHWLENGAYLFVCGDAQRMAKDVEAALLQIIQVYGQQDAKSAADYIKKLRTEKRYLRDVY